MSNCLLTNAFSPASWTDCPEKIKIRFQIPLYQRPYAWKPEQINQLLEDLWNASYSHTQNPYYIGILSVAPTSHDQDLFDLIDGQQRITTLILIGRALKNKNKDNTPTVQWNNFLAGRLHLIGRTKDENYLNSSESSLYPENPNFRIAVETISTFLDTKNIDNISDFNKFVFYNTHFFLSQAPAGYGVIEKNQQFVRLNNRGRQLEKHEILKVKLLAKVSAENALKCAEIWNTCSQLGTGDEKENNNSIGDGSSNNTLKDILAGPDTFDKKITERSERLYAPLLTFEEFLLIALERFFPPDQSTEPKNQENVSDQAQQSKPDNIAADPAKLLTSFQADNTEIWKSNAERFFNFMNDQNELLKYFFIQRDLQDKYKLKDKSKFNDQTVNPEQRQHLIVLQSYLYVSRPAHKWMKEAFNWLASTTKSSQGEKEELLIDKFIKTLEEIDNKDFIEKMREKDFTEKGTELGCSTPHYWFYRLDYELWKQRKTFFNNQKIGAEDAEEIAGAFVFRRRNSVEHIEAQTSAVGNTPGVDNSFANLALITISQNSKLSNNLFNAKRELIQKWSDEKTLPSLKLLHAFTFDKWDEDNKIKHMAVMRAALGGSKENHQSSPDGIVS